MNKPGQTAYEAYYRAIGGWAQGHHWAMISSDEQRAWQAVEEACRAGQSAPIGSCPTQGCGYPGGHNGPCTMSRETTIAPQWAPCRHHDYTDSYGWHRCNICGVSGPGLLLRPTTTAK